MNTPYLLHKAYKLTFEARYGRIVYMVKAKINLILPWLFIIVGLVILTVILTVYIPDVIKINSYIETKGRVVDVIENRDSSKFSYWIVVEYTVENQVYQYTQKYGTNPAREGIGNVIKVWYKENNPSDATIAPDYSLPLVGGVVCIVSIIMGITLLIKFYRNKKILK